MKTLSHNLRRAALAAGATLLLAGCGSILGPSTQLALYRLDPGFTALTGVPATQWQIDVAEPAASEALDTKRIVLTRGLAMDYYANAAWADQATDLIQGLLVRALEKSGKVKAVGPTSGGVRGDLLLVTTIEDFSAHYASENAPPTVKVDIVAKLITATHHDVVATHEVKREAPASVNSVPAVVEAFNTATGEAVRDIARWALENATPKASDALPPTTAEPVHRRPHHRGRRHG